MQPLRWLKTVILITGLTLLTTYLIPINSALGYLRATLAIIFIFLIPGNCLVNILFRKKDKIDIIEETVLSVALSFGITGITGLFLGLTSIGLNFLSITTSLSTITIILAVSAFILKNKENTKQIEQQPTET
jgi:uncharacterized membrane protein